VDSEFVYYYLKSAKRLAEENASGTTFKEISAKNFSRLPIPLPPLPEQKKIVEKIEELFSQLDSGVASLKKAKEQLRIYRQSVLAHALSGRLLQKDDIFSHSDSVQKDVIFSGKAAEPQSNYAPIKRDDIFHERDSIPKDVISNGIQLPEGLPAEDLAKAGWKWVKLGELISPSKERFEPLENDNQKYIGLEHIEKGTGKILGNENSDTVRSTKTIFSKGDLLYGKLRPYLNKVTIAEFNGVCSTDILVFNKREGLSNSFLKYRMLMEDFVSYAQNHMSGVQHPRINFKSLSEYDLMLPNYNQQTQIVEEIESRFAGSEALEKAINDSLTKAETLRQSILKRAFEGKLV